MAEDKRPTKAQFKTMPYFSKRALLTPTHNNEPITDEMKADFRARRTARRKKPALPANARVPHGQGNAPKPASVPTVSGKV